MARSLFSSLADQSVPLSGRHCRGGRLVLQALGHHVRPSAQQRVLPLAATSLATSPQPASWLLGRRSAQSGSAHNGHHAHRTEGAEPVGPAVWEGVLRIRLSSVDYHYRRAAHEAANRRVMHPGMAVRQDCIERNGLSVTDAARILGVDRQTLSNLLNARSGISPEMAVRLEKAFGTPARDWLLRQLDYELAEVMSSGQQD